MTTIKQGSPFLRPIFKKTLPEQVVVILKRFILAEKLKEGDRLPPERELAATLGVSHRVLREALSILSGEGIIIKEHSRGVFIRKFDHKRLQTEQVATFPPFQNPADVYKVRCALEIGAVCLAARHATDEDIAELEEILKIMVPKAEQRESLATEEIRFHRTLLRATHSEILQKLDFLISEGIRLKVYEDPSKMYYSARSRESMAEHREIVDALRQRDETRAMLVMYTHLIGHARDVHPSNPGDPFGGIPIRHGIPF